MTFDLSAEVSFRLPSGPWTTSVLSASLCVLVAVEPLKRLGSREFDRGTLARGPLRSSDPSDTPAASFVGSSVVAVCEGPFGFPDLATTALIGLGWSFGVSDGGDEGGKPSKLGVDDVVTDAV